MLGSFENVAPSHSQYIILSSKAWNQIESDHGTLDVNYTVAYIAICHRMSATLKSTGGGSLWGKI